MFCFSLFILQIRLSKVLWFHIIEHSCLFVEDSKYLLQLRIAALDYESHIFSPSFFASHFNRTRHIMLLLLSSVEPAEEEACTLCLLTALRAAHIEQYVGVLTKELFDDADDGLRNLWIMGRL